MKIAVVMMNGWKSKKLNVNKGEDNMNVTELIQQLQDFKEKHGDLKVCIDGEYTLNISKGVLFSNEAEDVEDVCLISSQYEDEEEEEEEEDKYKLWGAIVNDIRKIR